ncbi:hypothetical protein HKX15_17810 [Sulfitobacter sp. KE37]|nr:hypothetical protein [Sulfitobacter sp. KE12]MDF3355672.1 hypothetical protein [Sulfitobacter sp. KE27]MDF3370353.1 hypothetical protein [Sulfitobacter sp. Ks43]MDF3374004.1 hypothetical protein [Sulfitobacter sp. KS8]MDF3377638.1 hypothetical protein [Sulfitobacter sp. KE37]MDF3409233.1 hypothetical protein [Sulfitobacter sp. Ks39]MDF3438786.1 hypothetical protein [Sulfitobacter sp. Ks46]MDF3453235.1 hypothetical protein [Sulfitobacter sp. KE35]
MRHLYPTAKLVLWARSNGAELAKELKVTHAQSIDEAVDQAHVICTVTGAKEPILKLANVSEGCHINAVGDGDAKGAIRKAFLHSLMAFGLILGRYDKAVMDWDSGDV